MIVRIIRVRMVSRMVRMVSCCLRISFLIRVS